MTPELNLVLAEVRRVLTEELAKTLVSKGPETQKIGVRSHLRGAPGVGEADNIHNANDAVDQFVANIAAQLVVSIGMSEEGALDFVLDYFADPQDEHLSPIPEDDTDPEELALWLGKATTSGISAKIMKAARGG
jgi:hypothetical protein